MNKKKKKMYLSPMQTQNDAEKRQSSFFLRERRYIFVTEASALIDSDICLTNFPQLTQICIH